MVEGGLAVENGFENGLEPIELGFEPSAAVRCEVSLDSVCSFLPPSTCVNNTALLAVPHCLL